MRVIDRLSAETVSYHAEADADIRALLGAVTPADYRRFLIRTYGLTCPVERAVASVPGIERYVDPRRLRKHELLRRDLAGFRMTAEQVGRIPQCPVPLLDTPQQALGWLYPIERAALRHTQLFHHLAAAIPREVAFTSSYLKCYFGAVGAAWKGFGRALEAGGERPAQARRVVEAAREAFRHQLGWRRLADPLATKAAAAAAAAASASPPSPERARP